MGREPTSLGDTVVLSSNMMMEHTSNTQVCLLSKLCLKLENSRGEVKLDAGIRVNFNNVVDDGDNLRPVRRPATTQLGGGCFLSRSLYGHIAYVRILVLTTKYSLYIYVH